MIEDVYDYELVAWQRHPVRGCAALARNENELAVPQSL
jgi:hypothetical protein